MASQGTQRIGVDCRALVGQRAGIGRFLYRILEEVAKSDRDYVIYLYSPRPFEIPDVCKGDPRFRVRMMRFRPATLWLQLVVPVWLAMDRIDAFWGPNYAVPILKLSACVVACTIHDAVFMRFPESMLWKTRLHNKLMLPLYARASDVIITDSRFSARELDLALGLGDDMLRVVTLAGDNADFCEVGSDLGRACGGSSYVLSVGTIEPRKNLRVLVQAYSLLPEPVRKEFRLLIVGRRLWGSGNPRQWFQEYGVSDTAEYLDDVDDMTLEEVYANATLFVFPSLYEGFGLPVLEAMRHSVPVACSFGSSLSELGEGAVLFFNPRSPIELAWKMELLLSDSSLRDSLRARGEHKVRGRVWANVAEDYMNLLICRGEGR